MRISDWSSDVCSSDLQARSADLWGYMLCAGKACFTVEGQNQFELSAGDVVVVPAGAEHGIRSVGSPAAELSYAPYSYDEPRAAALIRLPPTDRKRGG